MDQHSGDQLETLLAALERDGAAHDAAQSEHRLKRLNLERDTARLVQLLVLSGQRRRILEIGTSNGYSGLWRAAALRQIPGAVPLVTIERDPAKADQARRNFAQVGLQAWVDVRVGSATQVVAELAGPFDAVFFDADRISAPEQLALLRPKFAPDVLLMADNALSHPDEIAGYIAAVNQLPSFVSMTVPIGKGLHVAHRLCT